MEQETSILHYTELKAIFHSTSKKELTYSMLNAIIMLILHKLM